MLPVIPDRHGHVSISDGQTRAAAGVPAANPTDSELAARIRDGDLSALGDLYDRYASMAIGVAMRIVRRRELAEDVVHDAYLAVWQRIRTFDDARGTLRSWLLVIVRNRAIDRVRAERPAMEIGEADGQSLLRTERDPTLAGLIARTTVDDLRAAMSALPAEQRHAIELAYFEGHTYREVAVLEGVPVGTANGRLRLALRKLRGLLSDE